MLQAGVLLQGRYQIRRQIGGGGMGTVYLADDQRLEGRRCAIKEMSPEQLPAQDRDWAIQAFRQEAQLLAQIHHPGLTAVTDFFGEHGNWYLVMDYVEGETLAALLERAPEGRLPVQEALRIIRQLLDVLGYLHGQSSQIIFRDLKPTNVMLTPEGEVRLIDFGIARFFKPGKAQDTAFLGTPGYAAPEQYGGLGQSDPRTDVYSLGVLLNQLVTGYDPTAAVSPFPIPDPRTEFPNIPAHVAEVISRATQMRPELRYPSVVEMRRYLFPPTYPLPVEPQETPGAGYERQRVPAGPPRARGGWSPVSSQASSGRPEASSGRSEASRQPEAPSGPPSGRSGYPASQAGPPPAASEPPRRRGMAVVIALVVVLGLALCAGAAYGASRLRARPPALATLIAGVTETIPPATVSPDPTATPTPTLAPTVTPEATWTPTATPFDPQAARATLEAGALVGLRYRPQNGSPIFVYRAAGPPVVDGQWEEWGGHLYTVGYVSYEREGTTWGGASDVSGTAQFLWDEANLYVSVRVADDAHVQEQTGDQIYRGDEIEIQIDANLQGDFAVTTLDTDDGQVGLSPGNLVTTPPQAYIWRPPQLEQSGVMINLAARADSGGYVLEAAVPWWVLGGFPGAGQAVGFCLSISDNDIPGDNNQQTMVSSSPYRAWGDPTTWGTLVLLDQP